MHCPLVYKCKQTSHGKIKRTLYTANMRAQNSVGILISILSYHFIYIFLFYQTTKPKVLNNFTALVTWLIWQRFVLYQCFPVFPL